MYRPLTMLLIVWTSINMERAEKNRVRVLIRDWAPMVWLAPGEKFLPLAVPEFLNNVRSEGDDYFRTETNIESILQNRSSFLYGRKPAGTVPIYALTRNCGQFSIKQSEKIRMFRKERKIRKNNLEVYCSKSTVNEVDDVLNENTEDGFANDVRLHESTAFKEENEPQKLHFHVTYWMFYPFSEGKAVCVLDLGFFGSWPIPTVGGMCLGTFKEYGNHVGDWEHMSLYFKGDEYPQAMYVSAHDAGAFYRYDFDSGTFIYESQETRIGVLQKPIFPERVFTVEGFHPVLFSARGSHGLWTAPGKHKFVRLPRLYDESGFGTAWPTWKKIEILSDDNGVMPSWMNFKGKWGNPKSNCHPLTKLGFNICEFVDGPIGIPMRKPNFLCDVKSYETKKIK